MVIDYQRTLLKHSHRAQGYTTCSKAFNLHSQHLETSLTCLVRRSLGAVRGRRRQAGRRVMDLGARTWLFLRELETEMKNWIAGVEMEVTELIQDAGYEVRKFVPKYCLSLKLCSFLCPFAILFPSMSLEIFSVSD